MIRNLRICCIGFIAGLIVCNLAAQEPLQTIRGQVLNAFNSNPLENASVSLLNGNDLVKSTQTDSLGRFRFDALEVGRYQLKVSLIAYETILRSEILLESGKESVLEIELEENPKDLETVEVFAEKKLGAFAPLSTYDLKVEQTLRLPATFYDPARMAMTYPGVTGTSDQANHLSIRGNSPNHLSWTLEGVNIVNPNHLTNAGTFNDRATQNGGGVNILSAQMLGNSKFRTGILPTSFSNSLSGTLDMRLRKGNDEKREYTAQIGLIGIDLSAEGPLSKAKRSSYLFNYRYSTLGLLSALGVDLGDEEITFQDAALTFHLPTQKAGVFKIFGIGGKSSNDFEGVRDVSMWEEDKDRKDIRYKSEMGLLGMTHKKGIGENGFLNTAIIFSIHNTERIEDELDLNLVSTRVATDINEESRLAFKTVYTYDFGRHTLLKIGGEISQFSYDIDYSSNQNFGSFRRSALGDESAWMIRPFLEMETVKYEVIKINLGLAYREFGLYDQGVLEPRFSLDWTLAPKHTLRFGAGIQSQVQPSTLFYETRNSGALANRLNSFVQSQQVTLGYQFKPTLNSQIGVEVYYQRLSNVAFSGSVNSNFSAANLLGAFPASSESVSLASDGTAKNQGIELSYQLDMVNDFYLILNASVFESKYKNENKQSFDTRFNSRYIFNATSGKEWIYTKKNRKRIFGINARVNYHGGYRDTPIDEIRSAAEGLTVFKEEEAFTIDQPDYFKLDIRISLKNNKPNFSSTIALDIQNATNQKNIAYTYFDAQKNEVVTEYQLGIIPILSYRIEF